MGLGSQEIFDAMRKNASGTHRIDEAIVSVGAAQARYDSAQDKIQRAYATLGSAWRGNAADAAQQAAKPLSGGAQHLRETLTKHQTSLADQGSQFKYNAGQLMEMPDKPTISLLDKPIPAIIDTGGSFLAYGVADEHNQRVYTEYHGASGVNGRDIPIDYTLSSHANTHITAAHSTGGGPEPVNPPGAPSGGPGPSSNHGPSSYGPGPGGSSGYTGPPRPASQPNPGRHSSYLPGPERAVARHDYTPGGTSPQGVDYRTPAWSPPGTQTPSAAGTQAPGTNYGGTSTPFGAGGFGTGGGSGGSSGLSTGRIGGGAGSIAERLAGGSGSGSTGGGAGAARGPGGSTGAVQEPTAAGRAGAAATGTTGTAGKSGSPGAMGGAPGGGAGGDKDKERKSKYVTGEEDAKGIVGQMPRTPPPVIGG